MSASIRKDGDDAVIRIPMSEVHGLRVALEPCPCRGSKTISTANIRKRLADVLARVDDVRRIPD
jgi:hypothetical protein